MAIRQDITVRLGKPWFLGEDKELIFEVLKEDLATPENLAGVALQWALRLSAAAADPALMLKTTGSGITIVGVYNIVRAVNTQRAVVAVASADYGAMTAKVYKHALKRTVAPKTVFTYGDAELLQAATQ